MVGAAPVKRALAAVGRDWRAFGRQMRVVFGQGSTRPGLYAYRFASDGSKVRLHLRVHTDGSGALFVNVDHVVHLSAGASEIARMMLDGVPRDAVLKLLTGWYPDAPEYELSGDVDAVAGILEALKRPAEGCPTCGLAARRTPLFAQRAQAPYKVDLAVTYACNNNCAHCYNEPGRKGAASLTLPEWKRVLRTLARVGVPHIIFTGGEPTLLDHLPAMVRYAEGLGQVTGVNTNGRRLADMRFAGALKRAGLDHVQITLASHLAGIHNRVVRAAAFDETVLGIRNALQADLHTITNTTLTRETAPEILETMQFVRELGVTTLAMNGMICSGGGRQNPDELDEERLGPILAAAQERAQQLGMRLLWYTPTEYCRLNPLELGLGAKSCNAAEYSICIEPDGAVLPCQSYYHAVGNILTDEWEAIWNCELFRRIRLRRENPQFGRLPRECWTCPDLRVCGGGCPLRRAQREAQDQSSLQEVVTHDA